MGVIGYRREGGEKTRRKGRRISGIKLKVYQHKSGV